MADGAVKSQRERLALVRVSRAETRREVVRALEQCGYAIHDEDGDVGACELAIVDADALPLGRSLAPGTITLVVMEPDAGAGRIRDALVGESDARADDALVAPVRAEEVVARVGAATARRAADRRLRSVVSHVPLLIFYVDDSGVIQLAEGKGLDLLGLDAQRLIRLSIFELFEDRPELLADVRRALAGESFRGKVQIGDRAFESTFHPVVGAGGRVDGLVLALADVSERDRAEEALRRSEASFRTLIESSPDVVFVHRFGRLVYINATALSLLGLDTTADLIGRPMLELVAEADRDAAGAQIRRVVEAGEVVTHEVRLVRSDGTYATTEMRAMAFAFDGQAAVLAVGRDISERKRLQSQLLQTDRLASLGTMAAGVAHQINNPLSYMITNLLFLSDEVKQMTGPGAEPLSESARADIRTAIKDTLDGAERVRQIVRHLGTFARPPDESAGRVDIAATVDVAIRMSWHQLRRVSRVVLDYRDLVVVRAGSAGLGHVVFHLLINAAQALEARPAVEREIRVTVRLEGGRAMIEVRDNGPGIEPSAIGSIFDPFFTTKAVDQGAGLGLSVCHSIVTSIGGTIDVASEPARGCVFTVALPVDESESRASLEPRRRFLLIENETWTLHGLQDALRGHPITITTDEAGALLAVEQEPFDAILCDVSALVASAAAFRRELADRGFGVDRPVVYLTHDDGERADPEVRHHTLRKPFKPDAVIALMRMLSLA